MAESSAWRKNRGWPGVALAAMCGTTALAQSGDASTDQSYGKWWAACDNANACSVYGTGGDRGTAVTLIISRGAEANAPVRATIVADSPRAPTAVTLWRLSIDGKAAATLRAQPGRLMRADLSPLDAQALATRIVAGGELRLEGQGAGASLGLNGAAEALRRMDSVQDRSGGPTALVDKGRRVTRPQSPPPLPVVEAQSGTVAAVSDPPKELRGELRACKRAFKAGPGDRQLRAFALPGDAMLWTVPCGRRGDVAYDLVMLSRADGRKMRPALPGDTFDGIPKGARGNVRFDVASGLLSETASMRSSSDCGRTADWAWSNGAFARVREREMPECVGLPLDLWPDTYRAVVRRGS